MTEPAGGQPGSSGVQWVGRNPDNQLPYVCWNHLPACIQNGDGAPFKTLFQGGYVIYFFALVHKIGRWMLPQNRVLMVTHAAVYQCMLTSHINRCVKIENLAEVYCLRRKNENWLGVKVDRARAPKEHDMLFDVAAPKVLDNFKAVVGRLYRDKMKKELPMLELGKDQSIKRFLHLKKDADFEVKKEPFVLQRDVWRAHAQRKKRAFDDSRAPSTAPSISGLAIEETVHLLKTETDSPCGLPRFPSEDRSPSPAPALGPAALGPAPAVRAVPSLGDRAASVDGRPPIAPPAQPAAAPAKPQYRMDEPLLVRRSSGHWDPCRVFDVRAESYLVETTETLAQKEVFFDDTDALLRRPPQDHRGLEVRVRDRVRLTAAVGGVSPGAVGTVVQIPGAAGHAVASARFPGRDAPLDVAAADIEWCSTDHSGAIVGYEDEVELLRDVTYDGKTVAKGTRWIVEEVPGDERRAVAQLYVDGVMIDVKAEDILVTATKAQRDAAPSASSPSSVTSDGGAGDAAEDPSPPPPPPPTSTHPALQAAPAPAPPDLMLSSAGAGRAAAAVPVVAPSSSGPRQYSDSPPLEDVLHSRVGATATASSGPEAPPAPAPAPAPPATREPSGISIFGVRHHSSCSHAVEDAEAAVEGLGHAALSGATSWDGEAAAAAAGMLPPGQDAGRSTLPLADAHGARRQSSAAVPAKPLGGEGGGGGALGMVFPDGDFGKLGEFITSLCHEYRSQVALLRDELTRKATHCSSLEQRLQEHGGVYTPASRPMSDPASSALRSRSHYDDLRASNETLRVELAHSQREQNDSIVQLLDHKFANLTASLGDKDHVIAAYTARNAELERGGHDAQEHIASLQQQLAERELEMQEVKEHAAAAQAVVDQQAQQLRIKEETHRAVVEELEEQILALQIANEAKQTDALLLREAVSLAEKRASATEDAAAAAAAPPSAHATDGIYAHLSQRQKRVYDMAPEELQAFLGNVLQFCPETCAAFAGMTGLQMMNMPLPDLNKRFRAGEYSILCDALQLVPMAEEREKQRGRAASRSPSRVTVLNCDGADTPELMSWILASRGKMVEDIWRGYEKIKSCKTLLTSASRVLHRGDRFMKEDLKGILERGAAATKAAEKGLAAVVTEYFMDFEKLHLGVAGMRSSTRRAASRSRSPSRRDGARLTPTEKRMLARMTTALFRSTRDHQAGGQRAHSKPRREVAPSLPLSYHDARTPSKERIESPDRRGASASADDDLLRLPKPQEPADPAASAGDSAQVLYLTPPPTASLFTQATAPPPSSPPRSRDDPPPPPRAGFPRGRDLDARAAMRAAAHAGASRSPGASRGRASSPNVAFGRSALPRTPSPLTRRRSGSLHKAAVRTQSPQSAASGGPTRRLLGVGGDRGAARHGYVFGGGHREQSHSDRSSRAESVPLSAWHTDLKPDHVFQTHS